MSAHLHGLRQQRVAKPGPKCGPDLCRGAGRKESSRAVDDAAEAVAVQVGDRRACGQQACRQGRGADDLDALSAQSTDGRRHQHSLLSLLHQPSALGLYARRPPD